MPKARTAVAAALVLAAVSLVRATPIVPANFLADATDLPAVNAVYDFDLSAAEPDEDYPWVAGCGPSEHAAWFRLTTDQPALVTITVTATGASAGIVALYQADEQFFGTRLCQFGASDEPVTLGLRTRIGERILVRVATDTGGPISMAVVVNPVDPDECPDAQFFPVQIGTPDGDPVAFAFDTTAATPSGPAAPCDTAGGSVMQNSVFYPLYSPFPATVEIELDSFGWDSVVALYRPSSFSNMCAFDGTLLDCADDPEPSILTAELDTRTYYLLQIGDFGLFPQGGPGVAEIRTVSVRPADFFGSAAPISPGSPMSYDSSTYNISSFQPGSCNQNGTTVMQNSAFVDFYAESSGRVRVTVDPTTTAYDAMVSVYGRQSDGGLGEIACGDVFGTSLNAESATFEVTAGQVYLIQAGTWGSVAAGGPTTLSVEYLTPSNDDIPGAKPLVPGVAQTVDNSYATPTTGVPVSSCNSSSATVTQNDVWYSFSTPTSGRFRLTVSPGPVRVDGSVAGGYDAIAAVWNTSLPNPEVACGDEPDLPLVVDFNAQAGEQYLIQIGDWGSLPQGGQTRVQIDPTACSVADLNFDGLLDFGDVAAFVFLFNAGATDSSADLNGDGILDFGDVGIFVNAFAAGC